MLNMKALLDGTTLCKLLCSLMESHVTIMQYLENLKRIQGCQFFATVCFPLQKLQINLRLIISTCDGH